MKPYIQLVIMPVVLVLWGWFGAPRLLDISRNAFIGYETPYIVKSEPGNLGEPLSAQVMLIVVSGLRTPLSQDIAPLNMLRSKGAERRVQLSEPLFALPARATLLSGARVEQHGQTNDLIARPLPIDSLIAAARRSGVGTHYPVGSEGWDTFFSTSVKPSNTNIRADSSLALIHLLFDDAGTNSQSFGQLNQTLERILQSLDLSRQTVLVVGELSGKASVSGEQATTLIAAGKGIRPGAYLTATLADIAPTVAALLGTSFPTDNQGDALFDMLDMPEATKAQRAVDWAKQVTIRYDAIANFIGVSLEHRRLVEAQNALAAGQHDEALKLAQAEVKTTRDATLIARDGRLLRERLPRLPYLLLYLLPLLGYIAFMGRMGWEFRRPLIGALVYFVVFYGLFYGLGYSHALSLFREIRFEALTPVSLIAALLMAILLGVLTRDDDYYFTALDLCNATFWVVGILWFQVCVFYWVYDFRWAWYLPDATSMTKYFVDVQQMSVFVGTPLLAFIALWVKRIAHNIERARGTQPTPI